MIEYYTNGSQFFTIRGGIVLAFYGKWCVDRGYYPEHIKKYCKTVDLKYLKLRGVPGYV